MARAAVCRLGLALVCLSFAWPARAAVTRIEIARVTPHEAVPAPADGPASLAVPAYDEYVGRVHYALDPALPCNAGIVDLALAPRNAAGLVECSADLLVCVPREARRGALFYEVNNRGNRPALSAFGLGHLLRQGYVVCWSGWSAEVQPGGGRLRFEAPVVGPVDGQPVTGIVRAEVSVDRPAARAALSHRGNQGSYRPTEGSLPTARLTARERQADPRREVPRSQWRLVETVIEADGARGQLPLLELELDGGLQPGTLYELIYEAEGPLVQGAGLAAIRDLISFLKHERSDANPFRDPAGKPLVTRAHGFGVSQSGRLLRQFVLDGFNADESGRRVFDGLWPHVAGGGLGHFNHRFAAPTRTNGQHEEHDFPADMFPFTYGDETDPFTGTRDGILRRARAEGVVPRVLHTQSTSEYWHRAGSLVHTDPAGQRDATIPEEVRLYTFGGSQHGPGSGLPRPAAGGTLPDNPLDYRPLLRGLLERLDRWVAEGQEPPPSVYPRVADGTLVEWAESTSGWHATAGVEYPRVIHLAEAYDRGPEWATHRRTSIEPPRSLGAYGVRVPGFREDNNERGTLDMPALAVPVATYTAWNVRSEAIGAAGELLHLRGGFIPLAPSRADREARGDPRPSLEERYPSAAAYREAYRAATARLVEQGFVLADEVPALEQLGEDLWTWANTTHADR